MTLRTLKTWTCISLVFVTLLMTGCTCNGNKQDQQQADSLAAAREDSLTAEGRTGIHQFSFDNQTNSWLSSALGGRQVDASTFSSGHIPDALQDSSQTNEDVAIGLLKDPTNFQPDSTFYHDYSTALRWSPDSSYILDIGSYGTITVKGKEGRTTLEGGEPDTKILVASPQQHKQWLVMFAGPGTEILDTKWHTRDQFLLLYSFDKENGHPDTTLIVGDMRTKSLQWFQLNNQ